ncbi:M1 family aminopeptidase [Bacteroidia bacterium]|nr:M1 family aminopeptidase [Bacteroidia bacterium]
MSLRLVWILSLVLIGSLNSKAQKFCQHMRLKNQMTTQNTFDARADTFNVLSYEINAEFLNYQSAKRINANTTLKTVLKVANTGSMRLDLLRLDVSDVKIDGVTAIYNYSSPNLMVMLPPMNENDTFDVTVFYNGNPQTDPQWGGFYFTGEYAFNLGVGFASDPHNFGRVWFPCFDNFTDRALYYTNITVDSGYKAYANGYLTNVENNGNATQTYKWIMDESIPTYLASVAIARYEEVNMMVDGIPVQLTSLAEDTANLRSSFENIPACIRKYEAAYGDHTFDRIGFNIVPFNSGAMEHATNIAYPLYAIAGGAKTSETLYAHELAHHWWGNTITCSTQEDMWLNEGWASYSESLFIEAVYGKDAYDENIENNHRDVLQFAHVRDEAILPVSGIGHANTYGNHVYNKGADMAHSLRGIMGDEDFFSACKSFQSTFKFKDVSTDDMKNHYQKFTTLNLDGFFDQWIKKAGFAHFDLIQVIDRGENYDVRIKQTPRFNEEIYKGVRVSISAFDSDFSRYDQDIVINNADEFFTINCPFEPVYWALDFDDKISDAVTTDWAVLKDAAQIDMPQGMMKKITANFAEGDSLLLRIEHHWAPADGSFGKPSGAELSKQRYWTVDGIWDDNIAISSEIIYSGLLANSADFGYLDNELIQITEDSLTLLYRPNAGTAWTVAIDYSKKTGSLFDKRGTITISNLKRGQYTLAMYDGNLASITRKVKARTSFKVFPNPAADELNVEFADKHDCCILEITNLSGQVVLSQKLRGKTKEKKLDISSLTPGTYFVGVVTDNLAYDIKRFVVE